MADGQKTFKCKRIIGIQIRMQVPICGKVPYLRMLKSAREVKAFCESRIFSGDERTNVAKVTAQ